jgi:hypothetical protein
MTALAYANPIHKIVSFDCANMVEQQVQIVQAASLSYILTFPYFTQVWAHAA